MKGTGWPPLTQVQLHQQQHTWIIEYNNIICAFRWTQTMAWLNDCKCFLSPGSLSPDSRGTLCDPEADHARSASTDSINRASMLDTSAPPPGKCQQLLARAKCPIPSWAIKISIDVDICVPLYIRLISLSPPAIDNEHTARVPAWPTSPLLSRCGRLPLCLWHETIIEGSMCEGMHQR